MDAFTQHPLPIKRLRLGEDGVFKAKGQNWNFREQIENAKFTCVTFHNFIKRVLFESLLRVFGVVPSFLYTEITRRKAFGEIFDSKRPCSGRIKRVILVSLAQHINQPSW